MAPVAGALGHDVLEDFHAVFGLGVEAIRSRQGGGVGTVRRAVDGGGDAGLAAGGGGEKAALNSIHALFDISREVIKRHQRDCIEFTKLAVVVLNQVIRPFTAKWHRKSLNGLLGNGEQQAFRADLAARAVQKSVAAKREGPDAGAAVFPVATRATRPAGSRRASGAAMPEASARGG